MDSSESENVATDPVSKLADQLKMLEALEGKLGASADRIKQVVLAADRLIESSALGLKSGCTRESRTTSR